MVIMPRSERRGGTLVQRKQIVKARSRLVETGRLGWERPMRARKSTDHAGWLVLLRISGRAGRPSLLRVFHFSSSGKLLELWKGAKSGSLRFARAGNARGAEEQESGGADGSDNAGHDRFLMKFRSYVHKSAG